MDNDIHTLFYSKQFFYSLQNLHARELTCILYKLVKSTDKLEPYHMSITAFSACNIGHLEIKLKPILLVDSSCPLCSQFAFQFCIECVVFHSVNLEKNIFLLEWMLLFSLMNRKRAYLLHLLPTMWAMRIRLECCGETLL